jgi:hypothetical protein
MKLTKVDIAKALGMTYIGIQHKYIEIEDFHYHFHVFSIGNKIIEIDMSYKTLEKCWEGAAEKLLEPLVDYLLGNLDDE